MKKPAEAGFFSILAERVRFELTVHQRCTLDFESSAFDNFATFPMVLLLPLLVSNCCGNKIIAGRPQIGRANLEKIRSPPADAMIKPRADASGRPCTDAAPPEFRRC